MDLAKELAGLALELGAFKFNPEDPFTWASGYRMPVYNDNRLLLSRPEARKLVVEGFAAALKAERFDPDCVAGVATAGIPHAATLADLLAKPLIYIRDKPKDHGMRNRIEGIPAEEGLMGRKAAVVEDLISTGGSSARAVEAVRDAGGKAAHCLAIFSYGFPEGRQAFEGLTPPCKLITLLEFPALLEAARASGKVSTAQALALEEWRLDPFGWGIKRGFNKVEKR